MLPNEQGNYLFKLMAELIRNQGGSGGPIPPPEQPPVPSAPESGGNYFNELLDPARALSEISPPVSNEPFVNPDLNAPPDIQNIEGGIAFGDMEGGGEMTSKIQRTIDALQNPDRGTVSSGINIGYERPDWISEESVRDTTDYSLANPKERLLDIKLKQALRDGDIETVRAITESQGVQAKREGTAGYNKAIVDQAKIGRGGLGSIKMDEEVSPYDALRISMSSNPLTLDPRTNKPKIVNRSTLIEWFVDTDDNNFDSHMFDAYKNWWISNVSKTTHLKQVLVSPEELTRLRQEKKSNMKEENTKEDSNETTFSSPPKKNLGSINDPSVPFEDTKEGVAIKGVARNLPPMLILRKLGIIE